MGIPLLTYELTTQNARVPSFSIGNDESARINTSSTEKIESAYRQIFFHAMSIDRDPLLESQFANGQIQARDFIRGLLLSKRFRDDFYQCNSNYRIVEHVVGRALGRNTFGINEQMAWSVVIATKGFQGFIDALLDSQEYLDAYGYDEIPFQRSRSLPGRKSGELPFNQQAPRYGAYWRDVTYLRVPSTTRIDGESSEAWVNGQPPKFALRIWLALIAVGSLEIIRILLTIAGSMLSTGGNAGT
ncbi:MULTISPECIES: phycobilisome rod-core linker polypeptide [unclassified Synechococcus]|uniref:phycobilisome rod-core linker polypeptide n=1 Tax=unclassified Synechococcus TaxID=2626047 RepID=UPI0021A37C69|nr:MULTISPECIES: phycobilisome rod-core linker polypeptide [unclassified Synechococcus]MCT0214072.1 phycobilisome rod-core linker polypeptide [Synechococcus sp. CS-1326]MCT0234159.1 phycobilisome rod-core linker polypeptide [Synechococcus sp. CS-1327]